MPTPVQPILVMGLRGGTEAKLLRYGVGFLDDDESFLLSARTVELAPAGASGKAAFVRLYVAVTFSTPFVLHVTPYVDGKAAPEYAVLEIDQADFDDVTQDLVIGERRTHLFEITLSLPYVRATVERFRYAMQGCYFQAEIEQGEPLGVAGELIIESVELEFKVLTKGGVQ